MHKLKWREERRRSGRSEETERRERRRGGSDEEDGRNGMRGMETGAGGGCIAITKENRKKEMGDKMRRGEVRDS